MKRSPFHPKIKIDLNVRKRFFSSAPVILFAFFLAIPFGLEAESRDLIRFEKGKSFFKKGLTYFNGMNYLAAAEMFRNAVKEYPDYTSARDFLARSYRLSGFTEAAIKEYENLAEERPENLSAQARIEALRFMESAQEGNSMAGDLVLQSVYKSADFGRFSFKNPVDIALDSGKNLYITSFSTGKIVCVDPQGTPFSIIQPSLTGKLYGIDCAGDKLAVTDFSSDKVYLLNLEGKKLREFGAPGSGEGMFHGPEGVCFDGLGNIFVADSGNHRVQKFNPDGGFLLSFGTNGDGDGEMSGPSDAAVLKEHVYVTDTGNSRLICFDDSGNFIKNISLGLKKPKGISVYGKSLIVSDEKKGLLIYDPETEKEDWIKVWKKERDDNALLFSSYADREGSLYCLDHNLERVYLFSPARKIYSNMEVEITSTDTSRFPIVAFYMNVRNRDGAPIYGLGQENFFITENSAPIRKIHSDTMKKISPSMSAVLVADRSRESREYRNDISWAADFILSSMRKNDAIRVVNFNKDVWEGSQFDWSRRRALRAITKAPYGKGKDFGSALYGAVSDLVPRLSRRGVVLVTDGSVSEDSFRKYSVKTISAFARAHYIPIFIISFKKPDEQLVKIAKNTGGAVVSPSQIEGLKSIYSKIKGAEEYRYVLVYRSYCLPSFRGLWSDVKLEVKYRGQTGSEWGGYFVP